MSAVRANEDVKSYLTMELANRTAGISACDEESGVESDCEEERLEYEYERMTKLYGGSYKCTLKKGIMLKEVADKGTVFDIDAEATESLPEEERDGYFDKDLLKYARYDIVYDDNESTTSDINDLLELTTPFEDIAKDAVDISPDQSRSVLKKIISEGFGRVMPEHAFIRMHYNVYTEFSPEPFDSSLLRNSKQQLRLNDGRTLPGLEIALGTMKRGEKALFLIKPHLAFGDLGVPPRIPPKATLLYDVEILEFAEGSTAVEMMTPEERDEEMGFRKIMKLARGLLLYGNKRLKEGKMDDAADKFFRGIHLLEKMSVKDGSEEYEKERLLVKFYNNMAFVQEKKNNVKRAAYFSRTALKVDQYNCKALYRLGRALVLLHDYREAQKFLTRAKSFCPNDPDILSELRNLSQRKQTSDLADKAFARAAFGMGPKPKPAPPPVASKDFQEEVVHILKEFQQSSRKECLVPGDFNDAETHFISNTAMTLDLSVLEHDSKGISLIKDNQNTDPGNENNSDL